MLNAIFFFFFSILFILGVLLLIWVSDRSPARTKKEKNMKHCPQTSEAIMHKSSDKVNNLTPADQNFDTETPGIFIAGEPGGNIYIKEATEQAVSAIN